MTNTTTTSNSDTALLTKINKAVAAANAAEKVVTTAQLELVSKSKVVGQLLLEAKKRHPKGPDFDTFLNRVNGLKLSRAYDLMRLAGGRTTHEELRKDTRERVRKHRAKKKLPKPEPVSVTAADVTETPKPEPKPRVTESPEISLEQRRAEYAQLDQSDEELSAAEKSSAHYLNEFKVACRAWLPKVTDPVDQMDAIAFVKDFFKATAKKAEAA